MKTILNTELNPNFDTLLKRIQKCINPNTSYYTYLVSLAEEFGELCEGLKVHHEIVKHKKLKEPFENEAVDLFICAATLYLVKDSLKNINAYSEDCNFDEESLKVKIKDDPFKFVVQGCLTRIGYISNPDEFFFLFDPNLARTLVIFEIMFLSVFIFEHYSQADFIEVANRKVEKWERNIANRNNLY